MRVLLIMPPFERLMGINFSYFPIGLGYLAACLKETGTDVKIYNVENPSKNENLPEANNRLFLSKHDNYIQSLRDDNHAVWHEVRKVLEEFRPDVVGISVTTAKVTSAYKISSLCKKINPSCHVVWGGPHPTILPEQTLGYEGIDFVVRGEGERTLAEFIQAINSSSPNLSRIKGLSYKKNGAIVHNELRPYIENLDTLPFPAKDEVLYPERYLPWDMGVMITSRGCPFKCTYCGARNIWGKKTRYRTATNVIEEIKYVVKNYHTKQIFFWDDTFNLNRKRVSNLYERLIDEKIGITWRCTARVDLLDDAILKMMRKTGCNSMDIGIETGSEKMLRLINKGITREQILKGISLIRKNGINFNAFFMIGFPDETEGDIQKTFELIKRKEMGNIILSIFTPYPGTELYNRTEELGLISETMDWSLFSHQSPHNHFVKGINRETFKKIVGDISLYVDKHNSSLKVFLKIHKSEIWFYLRNPLIFFRKFTEKIKSYFRGT